MTEKISSWNYNYEGYILKELGVLKDIFSVIIEITSSIKYFDSA